MDAPSLRGLLPPWFVSRKSFSCFIFPESDGSIQDTLMPIAQPIEIPPLEKLQSLSPTHTTSAAKDPDFDASSPLAATPIDAAPSFELSTPPHPSLAAPRSNLRHLPRLKALSNSLVRPRLPKVRRRALILRPQILKQCPAQRQRYKDTSPARCMGCNSCTRTIADSIEIQSSTVAPLSVLSCAGTLPVRCSFVSCTCVLHSCS